MGLLTGCSYAVQSKMLKELTEMCFQDDAIAQKLAVLSLLEVFKDIIPGYDALTRMTRATHTHTHTHGL